MAYEKQLYVQGTHYKDVYLANHAVELTTLAVLLSQIFRFRLKRCRNSFEANLRLRMGPKPYVFAKFHERTSHHTSAT